MKLTAYRDKTSNINFLIRALLVIVSAFAFSFAVKAFIQEGKLLSGGVTGIVLIITRTLEKFGVINSSQLLFSVLYFSFNIPLVYLAFKGIGRKFAILSSLHIIATTIFTAIIPQYWVNVFISSEGAMQQIERISCALFAGILTGISAGISFRSGASGGGSDIVSIHYSIKKQISVGNVMLIMNSIIVLTGGIILGDWLGVLYTVIYIYTTGRVIDAIHVRMKKLVVFIVTTKGGEIAQELMKELKRGCTILDGIGAYSGEARQQLFLILQVQQADKASKIAYSIDPHAFIATAENKKVYGNFKYDPYD